MSHKQDFRSPIPIETTVKKNAIVSPSDKNENSVTNVHISRRGSVRISQHEESTKDPQDLKNMPNILIPIRAVFHCLEVYV